MKLGMTKAIVTATFTIHLPGIRVRATPQASGRASAREATRVAALTMTEFASAPTNRGSVNTAR